MPTTYELDLRDFIVTGTGTGAGVRIAQHTGVEVNQKGTISGFNEGLVLDESDGDRIHEVTLRRNVARASPSQARTGTGSRTTGSRATAATGSASSGLSADNIVKHNKLTGNVFGIGVADFSSGNTIEDNHVTDSVAFGIAVFFGLAEQSPGQEPGPGDIGG